MIDILAVCAHPDDLEVCAGGIFAKAHKEGLKTGLIIFTKGESGGFADRQTRMEEAQKASEILHIDYFKMLDFPDAGLFFNEDSVNALIPLLREASPKYILTLLEDDYHPDHVAVSRITKAACFIAGLKKHSTDSTTWHYESIMYFGADNRTNKRRPDIYVDISDVFEIKKEACDAHKSQNITDHAVKMAKEYGLLSNAEYAEGLHLGASITVNSISSFMRK